MKFQLCELRLKSSFHVGEREGCLEGSGTYIHSDTLFSALCNSYLLLYGAEKLRDMLCMFLEGKPPFLMSSAFPFWKDEHFFPLPQNQIPAEKSLKRIQFVCSDGLKSLLDGQSLTQLQETIKTIPANGETSGLSTPWIVENIPRVGLSRLTNHPGENFFHFGQVYYREDAGLFFLFDVKDSCLHKQLKATICLMADEGIGGDRTCGKGALHKPQFSEIELPEADDSDAIYLLSLYFPGEHELEGLNRGYYQLIERKGYIYSPAGKSLRRKSIRVFTEGSVLPNSVPRLGKLVDVTPAAFKSHPVYRYGYAFSIPCQLEVQST